MLFRSVCPRRTDTPLVAASSRKNSRPFSPPPMTSTTDANQS